MITKNETGSYIPIFLVFFFFFCFFFLTVHKLLLYKTQGQMISFTVRERNKGLLINKVMLSDPATHPVILSYNKPPCINHFQPPSRPSCQWKPNFKQRFHGSIKYTRFTLYTVGTPWFNHGFTSTFKLKLWNPVSSGKRMSFRKLA